MEGARRAREVHGSGVSEHILLCSQVRTALRPPLGMSFSGAYQYRLRGYSMTLQQFDRRFEP
jgi:hypothetical protein